MPDDSERESWDEEHMSEITLQQATEMLTAPGAPFEIVETDIRGIRTCTWKAAPESLKDIFLATRAFDDRTYLVYEDDRMTYREHYLAVARLARLLVTDYGIQKGDRIAIAMRNYPEWPVCFWAASIVGAIVVPLNAWWTAGELAYGLADSGAKLLFADGQRAELLRDNYSKLQLEQVIAIRATDELPPGVIHYEEVLGEAGTDDSLPEIAFDPEDEATIFYTSGTTGNPKGALGTQRNICGNLVSLMFAGTRALLRQGEDLPDPTAEREQQVPLLSVPFFHATGCHSVLVANTVQGNKLVMMHRWDPERALELIEREKITTFGGVPSMVWQVLESPGFAMRDTSSLLTVAYGGAPAAPELVTRIQDQFPATAPSNGYGLTETSSVTTLNAAVDYIRKPDSVGPPVPVCEVTLMDDQSQPTPARHTREI